ncbi:P-loop containing nucleoside triphosphate hydrolase protein [Gigaspora rosea]|uniref:(d)CMP kinase n=1 Tax=Gigaspora rosea TaxID=44941 RepID=A0A397V6G9_9GLOM|nr:P-loop containing nucleoside triphosphate hydrolase protein [Gigaspora rosea]
MKINIAIDGLASSGKTMIGKKLSEKLKYQFIDSGFFYRYFANKFYIDNTIQINEIYLFKNEIFNNSFYHLKEIEYIIQTITKKKGFVVVGHDATTKILPDAKIKLVFNAEIETRVYRRAKQILDIQNFDAYNLVMEAKKVATIINTSNLSIEQVLAKILRYVYWYNFSNDNLLHSGAKRRVIENGNPQEESSGKSNIEPTVEELIEYENWQITNYISDKAFIHVFPDLEKRYEFISKLLKFNQKCLENYEHIERDVLPRNRQDDLFRDAQDWRKNVLNGPKRGARFQISRLEELLKDLENEIDEFYEKIKKKILNKKIIMNN